MANRGKPQAKLEFNSFVKGIITEASPLNFPANASLDEENFELNKTGTRFRRQGMTFEDGYSPVATAITQETLVNSPPSTFKWIGAAGDSTKNFLVVKIENRLTMFDMSIEPLSNQVPVTVFLSFDPLASYSFASVDGRLIVAAGGKSIAIVSYQDPGTFFSEYRRLLTRDVWGVQETDFPSYENDVSFRGGYPGSASSQHKYNLQNQSWGIPRSNGVMLVDPVSEYGLYNLKYPSNSEAVWAGLKFQPVASGSIPFERIFPNLYTEVIGADVATAKGYYIIDVLDRGISRQAVFIENFNKYPDLDTPSVTLPADVTSSGASVVGEFAGRVFYGGFSGSVTDGDARSPNLSNLIFFSQLVKSLPDTVKCYQEGDPTSRESSDVVDTDGGFIRIAGMTKLLKLVNLSSSLIVIGANGIWSISGGSDYGFSATNFKVEKISTFGGMSAKSVVEFSGKALYWGEDGIYLVDKDQFGSFVVTSITENTIQSYYESIDNSVKAKAVGCYDSVGKKVRWFFNQGDMFTDESEQRELVFDLVLGAFVKNRIYNSQNNQFEIVDLFSSVEFKTNPGVESVFVGSDLVTVGINPVTIGTGGVAHPLQSTRYLTFYISAGIVFYVFSYYRDDTFTDWGETHDPGTDAFAFLLTGALTVGDSAVEKQTPYLTMHMYRTENGVDANFVPVNQSSCLVRAQWGFSNSINSNKWGPLQEAYRYRRPYIVDDPLDPYDTGFELITTKNKIRGRGKALSLFMATSPQKDCRIVGWNLNINANSN